MQSYGRKRESVDSGSNGANTDLVMLFRSRKVAQAIVIESDTSLMMNEERRTWSLPSDKSLDVRPARPQVEGQAKPLQ